MIPRSESLLSGRRHEKGLLESRRMGVFCGVRGKKPIAPRVRKSCYQGPGTRWQGYARLPWRGGRSRFRLETVPNWARSAELGRVGEFSTKVNSR